MDDLQQVVGTVDRELQKEQILAAYIIESCM